MAQGVTRQSHVRTGRGGPHGIGSAQRLRNQNDGTTEISHGAKTVRTVGLADSNQLHGNVRVAGDGRRQRNDGTGTEGYNPGD